MKYCLAVLVLAAVNAASLDEMKAEVQKQIEACVAEVNASDDDVATLRSHAIPASHEGKCVMFCMNKFFKLQNEDGSLNLKDGLTTLDIIKDTDPEMHGKLVTLVNTCGDSVVVDSDPCVTAINWRECITKECKAVGIDKSIFQ